MGICFGDNDNDCFTDMRFLQTMYSYLLIQKNSFKTWFVTSSAAQKNGTQNTWRKDENLQLPKLEQKKNWHWQHQRRDVCTKRKTKYLGQMIIFHQQETTENRNRIKTALATFHKYRQELTSKTYMLRHRLRLFDAMVSPTMNYASGTWTHTKEHERMIQCNATQNASLHHTN